MPFVINDVLKLNLVLVGVSLVSQEEQRNHFSAAVSTDVVTEMQVSSSIPLGGAPSTQETGFALTLNRDRIRVVCSQARSVVEREYPTHEDLGRFTEVIGHVFASTNWDEQIPRAFGYNIELVYTPEPRMQSSKYLAERLFEGKELGEADWELVGGGAKLVFQAAGERWSVALDQRANDPTGQHVFFSMNLHKAERRRPEIDEVAASFQAIWEQAQNFVARLDG